MAKKKFGKFVALATVSGVIAAGISYFLKYKSFHDELDEDFHDFEKDDEFDGELPHEEETLNRTYVTLNEKKTAAADTAEALAEKAADTAETLVKKAADAADTAVKDTTDVIDKAAEKAEDTVDIVADKSDEMADMVKDTVKDTANAAKDAAANMTTTIEDDVL